MGFSQLAEGYRPGRPPFSSPVRPSCRCTEGFVIRGWDLILSGLRWLYESRSISNQTVGLKFLHSTGWYTWGTTVLSPVCRSCRCMGEFMIREWDVILPGWRWLCEPRVVVSTPCGAASTRGTTVFVPSLLDLYIYDEKISDPGMICYPPWVARAPRNPGWGLVSS